MRSMRESYTLNCGWRVSHPVTGYVTGGVGSGIIVCTGEIIEAHAQGKHTGKGLRGARLVYVVRVRIQQR